MTFFDTVFSAFAVGLGLFGALVAVCAVLAVIVVAAEWALDLKRHW